MKTHPFRHSQAGKHVLRERIIAQTEKSAAGQRVVRECLEALELPVNSDAESRRLILKRFSCELDLLPHELEELLIRATKQKRF